MSNVSSSEDDEDRKKYGRALMSYLDAELDRRGITRPMLGKRLTGNNSNFTNWAKGTLPGLPQLRQIADALPVSAVELLFAIGFLTEDEAAGRIPSIEKAVQDDPDMSAETKAGVLATIAAARKSKRFRVRDNTRK